MPSLQDERKQEQDENGEISRRIECCYVQLADAGADENKGSVKDGRSTWRTQVCEGPG